MCCLRNASKSSSSNTFLLFLQTWLNNTLDSVSFAGAIISRELPSMTGLINCSYPLISEQVYDDERHELLKGICCPDSDIHLLQQIYHQVDEVMPIQEFSWRLEKIRQDVLGVSILEDCQLFEQFHFSRIDIVLGFEDSRCRMVHRPSF